MRIGIDIMGGDLFPTAPVRGAVLAQQKLQQKARLVLIGDETLIRAELEELQASAADFDIVHTPDFISMSDSPARALIQKPKASINLGIQLLKEKKINAFVSAGHTGAMLVASVLGLGTIPGVIRPTIAVPFHYGEGKISLICDVGANIDSKPEALNQFGLLGSVYMKAMYNMDKPRVSLINVGEEKSKGPQVVQAAYGLMTENPKINFIGNTEGWDFYEGKSDVYVCDGYTGNIILKFGESFYQVLKARYGADPWVETYNYEHTGGLPFLGVSGIVLVGHGKSQAPAFENMVHTAIKEIETGLNDKIRTSFQEFTDEKKTK